MAELIRASGLVGLVKPASQQVVEPDGVGERILPVLPELRALLPAGGLRRGATVSVGASPVSSPVAMISLAGAPNSRTADIADARVSEAAGTDSAAGVETDSAARAGTDSAARAGTDSAAGAGTDSAAGAGTDSAAGAGTDSAAGVGRSTSRVRLGPDLARTGATSVLLALLAAASAAGSWCAVVGMPALGLAAAAEFGIALERLVLVPDPGPDWPTVVAALLDGIDLVAVAPPGPVSATLASRLAARARQRGSVLIPYGQWSGADVVLETPGGGWRGLGTGWGRLARRGLIISSRGRGAAARPRQTTLWLPLGTVPPAAPTPIVEDPPVLEAVG